MQRGWVVFAGGERWDGVRGSHRQLLTALAERRTVLYVDPPVSALSRPGADGRARPRPGLRTAGPTLHVLVPPALPGLTRPGIRTTTLALTRRAIRQALHELDDPTVDALMIGSLDDLLTSCAANQRLVYATDDYVAGAELMGLSRGYLERCERRQAERADRVIVVSDGLADRWRRLGQEPVVVPNGCDPDAFGDLACVAPDPRIDLPAPIAGVVGRLSARIDLSLLEAVADRGRSLLLVGPLDPTFEPARVARLLARPNVQSVGEVPFERLPAFLTALHTGLTPYGHSPFNQASFPLKTLEYLAAGLGVVATDLPAHRWLDTDLVSLARGPAAFADAVDAALDAPTSPALVALRRAFAATHSWSVRAEQVDALIERPVLTGSARP